MFGVGTTPTVVEEEKLNAERNGITNWIIVSGKPEDLASFVDIWRPETITHEGPLCSVAVDLPDTPH